MARMYSRKKGKSGSKKPVKKTVPSWVRYKTREIELLVAKMSREKKTSSEIGMILRDVYGIPNVRIITGKSISKILAEKKLLGELPEDIIALIRKNIACKKHYSNNKKDMVAKRGIHLSESKIKRLVKYYKNTGRLPQDWKYDPEKVKLLID